MRALMQCRCRIFLADFVWNAHKQSCRKTSWRSRSSTADDPYSGGGSVWIACTAASCTSACGRVGLHFLANGVANWISLALTYSCAETIAEGARQQTAMCASSGNRHPVGVLRTRSTLGRPRNFQCIIRRDP